MAYYIKFCKGEGGRGISDLQIDVVLRLTASLLAGRLKKGTFPIPWPRAAPKCEIKNYIINSIERLG